AIKAAIGDAVITFSWVFCVSTVGALTAAITAYLQVQGVALSLAVTVALISLLLFVFNIISDAVGGASFNPTGTAAFYAAGLGSDNLFSMALRFPAQAAGAVGGAMAIVELMPPQYKHMLGGPSLKVDPHTGAVAEGVLTFTITFAVLWILLKGPRNPILKTWMLAVSTAFGWAYVNNRHNTWEQFYVYWICPFVGAILAAWVFRLIFPPAVKVKKA
ncbi:Aquaporin SIP1-2, partial [Ananas comosus]